HAVPLLQVVRRPRHRLVEMTEVARVGTARLHARPHVGARDLVAADPLQQPVRRVRHVTVVATAPGRPRIVAGGPLNVTANRIVGDCRFCGGWATKRHLLSVSPGLYGTPCVFSYSCPFRSYHSQTL